MMQCDEENRDYCFYLEDRIGVLIPQAKKILKHPAMKNPMWLTKKGAIDVLDAVIPSVIHIEREINKIHIEMKQIETVLMREFKANGIKTVKEQESLTREEMREMKVSFESLKEVRDKLRLKRQILEYIIEYGEDEQCDTHSKVC